MAGLPGITIAGTAVAEPELRFTATGTAVANVTVACNDRRFDTTTGQWADHGATFLRCTCWKQMAEHTAESVSQGARVLVTGQLRQRDWTDKDGNPRTSFEVDVTEIGVSLRWATATVTKANRAGGSAQAATGDAGWTTPAADSSAPPF